MHVEDQAGNVAQDEHRHDDHQDYRHAVLPDSPPLAPPPDGQVDLGVEEGDGDEGKDAEYQELSPVDIVGDVELVHSEYKLFIMRGYRRERGSSCEK